jgi:hypothetical protein
MTTRHGAFALAALACVLSACAAGAGTSAPPAAVPATSAAADSMVPAGFGTLRQDEITVSIRSGAVLVKVTPLDESVIRLLAPDTYHRLSVLRDSRRNEAAAQLMREPELFLVSFFSYQPDMPFQPQDVQIVDQARLLRPTSVIPLTSGWGQQRLGQQETQTAIYAFDAEVDFTQVMGVRYGMEESQEWRQIMSRLELERGRIRSRGGD